MYIGPTSIKNNNKNFQKVREPGVEPGSIAWKATMLPLYHSRMWYNVVNKPMCALHCILLHSSWRNRSCRYTLLVTLA